MSSFDFDKEIKQHLDVVRSLQKPSGVFTASAHNVATGYDKAWLRDIYFMTLGFFGPKTLKAVKQLQCANTLTCSGDAITTGYGFVGPKTRAILNQVI